MSENARGFHHPNQHNFERAGGSQGREEPPAANKAAAGEPTNHAGHTHEMARRHEHDARVKAVRSAHNSHHHEAPGGRGHEATHKSLLGDAGEHEPSKFGASAHVRDGEGD